MNSFEKDVCMSRKDPMSTLVCSDQASSKTDWGTQVDNSAQKSFACDQKLSLALSTTTLAATEMELHDHSLSSESSSSMSLDEDHTSFQHAMSCVCHVHDHVSDVVCMLCDEGLAVQGGELSTHSFPPLQEQRPPSKKTEKLEEHNSDDFPLNSFQQQKNSNNNKKLQDKNHRASKSKPVDSLEATLSVCHASLSVDCVYELSDSAWHEPHDPASVLTGQQEGQISASRKPGQQVTNNSEAWPQDKMLTNFQVTTRASPVGALLSMLGFGRVASFWGRVGSLASKHRGTALTQFPSTSLTDRELEKNSAELCLQELDSEELSQKELEAAYCKKSLQKELEAAYSAEESIQLTEQSFQLPIAQLCFNGPTRVRELELSFAQLCKSHFAIKSFQQKEFAAAYAFLAQSHCPTRARTLQLNIAQLCNQDCAHQSFKRKNLRQLTLRTSWLKALPKCSTRASRTTAAGKLQVAGDLRSAESILYVPLPQTMQRDLPLDDHDMYMDLRNVVQNNLARKGPDPDGAEELRYENVLHNLTTGSVDLVLKAETSYHPKRPANNGVKGEVGSIHLRGGRSTTYLFKFVATFIMAVWANLAFGLWPGMGMNAYFAYTIVGFKGQSNPVKKVMIADAIESVIFIVMSSLDIRRMIFKIFPAWMMKATMAGIGMFLAFIGLHSGNGIDLIRDDPAVLVDLVLSSFIPDLNFVDLIFQDFWKKRACEADRHAKMARKACKALGMHKKNVRSSTSSFLQSSSST